MSNHFVIRSLASLAAGVLLQSAEAHADTFEFVSYTPPSRWAVQSVQEGKAYVRAGRTGIITFYASRPDTSSVAEAFAAMWRMNVEPAVPGPVPEPQISRDGNFVVAMGARQADSQGSVLTVSLVTVTGRGRSLGVLGVAKGGEALRELTAFFDTVTLTPPASARAASGPPASGAAALVGRWWKPANNLYYWYEFTDKGFYSYETPLQKRERGTFRVQGDRITLTTSTGDAVTSIFSFKCVGGRVMLDLDGDRYWSNPPRSCSSD